MMHEEMPKFGTKINSYTKIWKKNENAQFYENKRKRGDIWLTRAA